MQNNFFCYYHISHQNQTFCAYNCCALLNNSQSLSGHQVLSAEAALTPVSVSQRRRLTEMAAAAGAFRRAGTRQTGVRGPFTMTPVEVGQTLLTVVALSVVLTVQTNTWGREGQYTEQLIISNSIDWIWESYPGPYTWKGAHWLQENYIFRIIIYMGVCSSDNSIL